MNQFVNSARQVPDSATENGAATFKSSLNSNVDFFFRAGASRGKAKEIAKLFQDAFREDPKMALRNLFWSRDVRGGAGERELFRTIVPTLNAKTLVAMVPFIPEFGRWDDLLPLIHIKGEVADAAANHIKSAISAGNGLAAKWMPRKGNDSLVLRFIWGMSPKAYRKFLVNATKVVETAMCSKDWTNIKFDHVPSLAAARYRKAFERNCGQSYLKYMEKLTAGEAKINASSIFPHDIIRSMRAGGASEAVCDAQWKALPNFVDGGGVLCVVDTSASMTWTAVSGNIYPVDIAMGLALYTSERLVGPYQNMFMTFSDRSEFVFLKPGASLRDRFYQGQGANVGGSTNINAAFKNILDTAKKNNVPAEDMPKMLLILSDMEFNNCGRLTNFQAMEKMYAEAGYKIPNVVFWNLNSRTENVPVRFDQSGVGLISGFSPAIIKSIMSAEDMNPIGIMVKTLMQDRYTIDGITI